MIITIYACLALHCPPPVKLPVMAGGVTAYACMRAQIIVSQWVAAHPGYRVKRWKCEAIRDGVGL